MKRIPRAVLIAAGLVAMASIVGGGIVFAQTSSASSPMGNLTALTSQAGAASNQSDYIAQLAGHLGISVQALQTAISATNMDELKKAVDSGAITQAQADKISAALQAGNTFFFGGHGPRTPGAPGGPAGPGHRGPFFGGINDAVGSVATFLGVTPAQLRTELEGGKSLADVATAHGKTRDELKAHLTTQANTRLDKAVADGKLTQAQADQLKSTLSSHLDQIIDARPGSMIPRWFNGGPGSPTSPRGGPRQAPGTTPSGLN